MSKFLNNCISLRHYSNFYTYSSENLNSRIFLNDVIEIGQILSSEYIQYSDECGSSDGSESYTECNNKCRYVVMLGIEAPTDKLFRTCS